MAEQASDRFCLGSDPCHSQGWLVIKTVPMRKSTQSVFIKIQSPIIVPVNVNSLKISSMQHNDCAFDMLVCKLKVMRFLVWNYLLLTLQDGVGTGDACIKVCERWIATAW